MTNSHKNKADRLIETQPQLKWFERKFDSGYGIEHFEKLLNRLTKFPATLRHALNNCSESVATNGWNDKWSINDNVGHLFLLECLWFKRFQEIKEGHEQMYPADLNNTATDQSSFNQVRIKELTERFDAERKKTIILLQGTSRDDLLKQSLHPRLKQPMTIPDMMYFVAEHDEHHLRAIQLIIRDFT